jgi:tyrosinase
MINIHRIDYTYSGYEKKIIALSCSDQTNKPHIRISGINRADANGSFVVSAWVSEPNRDKLLVAVEPVLSRWHVSGCANCGTHHNVSAVIPIPDWASSLKNPIYQALVHTRDVRHGQPLFGGRAPKLRLGDMLGGSKMDI